jgi:hypothetical protein
MKLNVILIAAFAAMLTASQAYADCAENTDVFSSVTQDGPEFTYDFTVQNGCVGNPNQPQPLLEAFFLPYFSDAGITLAGITVPSGWTATIEASNNVFNLLDAGVIEFVPPAPFGYNGYSGFSYTSEFAPVVGPYAIERNTGTLFGDPSIPGSPEAITALADATTPEPSTTGLLALGLCAIVIVAKRRRTKPVHQR